MSEWRLAVADIIAQAICKTDDRNQPWRWHTPAALAVLAALHEAGYAVVPRERKNSAAAPKDDGAN